MRDTAAKHFKGTERDRAVFELGIKLGGVYHQYTGIPIDSSNVREVERTIEKSLLVQPFVVLAKIKIVEPSLRKNKADTYGYSALTERNLTAKVAIEYEGWRAEGEMGWVDELGYPLMRVTRVVQIPKVKALKDGGKTKRRK
jgi:hypothetical protein